MVAGAGAAQKNTTRQHFGERRVFAAGREGVCEALGARIQRRRNDTVKAFDVIVQSREPASVPWARLFHEAATGGEPKDSPGLLFSIEVETSPGNPCYGNGTGEGPKSLSMPLRISSKSARSGARRATFSSTLCCLSSNNTVICAWSFRP
jgi:hypothetical protein